MLESSSSDSSPFPNQGGSIVALKALAQHGAETLAEHNITKATDQRAGVGGSGPFWTISGSDILNISFN